MSASRNVQQPRPRRRRRAPRVSVFPFGAETWVHVLSDTVVDWPTVRASLPKDVRAAVNGRPRYTPHLLTPEERAQYGYRFADWWTFGVED